AVAGLLTDKGLTVVWRIDPTTPRALNGDPGRLRQVIVNLLGNAIKFTEQGEVTLEITPERVEGRRVVLRAVIRDTGVGISPEGRSLLFQSFTQLDGSTVRRYGGTGLGLAICKRLVTPMDGRLRGRSEGRRRSRVRVTPR